MSGHKTPGERARAALSRAGPSGKTLSFANREAFQETDMEALLQILGNKATIFLLEEGTMPRQDPMNPNRYRDDNLLVAQELDATPTQEILAHRAALLSLLPLLS